MKKILLPLIIGLLGLVACGGSNLGKAISESEFLGKGATAAHSTREVLDNLKSIEAKGQYKNSQTGMDMPLDCVISEETAKNPTPAMEIVAAVFAQYTYEYANNQFKAQKQTYEPQGAKCDMNYFYDEATGNLGFDALFVFNQTDGQAYINQSLKGTYQWNKYGLLIYCDEVGKGETNLSGGASLSMVTHLEITYNF